MLIKYQNKFLVLSKVYVFLIFTYFICGCGIWDKEKHIAELQINDGTSIEISLKPYRTDLFVHQLLYSKVTDMNLRNLSKPIGFAIVEGDVGKLEFDLVRNKDGSVLGIVEQGAPNKIIMLYDLKNDFQWNGHAVFRNSVDQESQVLSSLINSINKNYKSGRYDLDKSGFIDKL